MAVWLKRCAPFLTGLFLLSGAYSPAWAQSTESVEAEAAVTVENASEVSAALAADIQQEIADYMNDATDRFRQMDSNALMGMGVGMISGAVLTDLLGGSGLVTLTGMIAGGVAGIWAADNLF